MAARIDQSGLKGQVRDKPVAPVLFDLLQKAADAAQIDSVVVTSGGQPGSTGRSIGSTRHNGGRAADLHLVKGEQILTFSDDDAHPAIKDFVTAAAADGAIGMGAGLKYMGDHTLHIGFGTTAEDHQQLVWGAGGRSRNAPLWLQAAAQKGWRQVAGEASIGAGPVVSASVAVGSASQESLMSVPIPALRLLSFIGSFEAPMAGYNQLYNNGQRRWPRTLTSMSLDEVLQAQPTWTRLFGSSAAGRYQFIFNTLAKLKSRYRLNGSQSFDHTLQDTLGYYLLVERGYNGFVQHGIPLATFALNLAKEWASLPVLETTQGQHGNLVLRGQSYYQSDGVNHALVDPLRFEATLKDVLAAAQGSTIQITKPETPMPQSTKPSPAPVTLPEAPDSKPWYLSKGVIGGLIAVAAPLISLMFPEARKIDTAEATDWIIKILQVLVPVAGGVLATVGRVQATVPIAGSAADKLAKANPPLPQSSDNPDLMTLPVWQVLAQLPELLSGLQQIQAATGTIIGDLRHGATASASTAAAQIPSKDAIAQLVLETLNELGKEAEGDQAEAASAGKASGP